MGTKRIRAIMKIFGFTGGTGEFGKIGSKAAGTPETTKDLTLIQSLSRYLQGLNGTTSDQGTSFLPYLEDFNSIWFLTTSQLAYLFDSGVPEWLDSADQEYFINQGFVSLNGSLYVAIKGDGAGDINVQKNPETNPLWWKIIYTKDPVSAYDVAEAVAYESAGVLVESYGKHYSSTGKAGNAGKEPSDPVNVDYWYKAKDDLEDYAMTATPLPGSFHVITDRAHAQYNQNILLDKKFKGSQEYNLDAIMLDGTVITGDSHLEDDILKIGTADEYPFLDKIATFNLAVWTLDDMGGRTTRAQSVSGKADTMRELQDDATIRITGSSGDRLANGDSGNPTGSESGAITRSVATQNLSSISGGTYWSSRIGFDNSLSVSPNTAKTDDDETRMLNKVTGIIPMVIMSKV